MPDHHAPAPPGLDSNAITGIAFGIAGSLLLFWAPLAWWLM